MLKSVNIKQVIMLICKEPTLGPLSQRLGLRPRRPSSTRKVPV